MNIHANPTRPVRIGSITIGGGYPVAVQSMAATRTQDVDATVGSSPGLAPPVPPSCGSPWTAPRMPRPWRRSGGRPRQPVGRFAGELPSGRSRGPPRQQDPLQPRPSAITTNGTEPGSRKSATWSAWPSTHDCALRVGVNCGSVDPEKEYAAAGDSSNPMLQSAWEHCELLDSLGFTRYCVSLKDSDPAKVIEVNRRFAERGRTCRCTWG